MHKVTISVYLRRLNIVFITSALCFLFRLIAVVIQWWGFLGFLLRKYFAMKKFSIMLVYRILGRGAKEIPDDTWFVRRTCCPWTRRSSTRTCSPWWFPSRPRVRWYQRLRWLSSYSWSSTARTKGWTKHHAVGSGRSCQHFKLSLLIDDKVVSLNYIVGVKFLVGELHFLRPGNLGHFLVVVPESHVGRGQSEVSVQGLLELLHCLPHGDPLLSALVLEVEADLQGIEMKYFWSIQLLTFFKIILTRPSALSSM